MKKPDLIEETYSALLLNKARSGLTILGIIIGIASVIAMVSIGQGAQSSIELSIQSLGSNLLMIQPGAQRGIGMSVSAGRNSSRILTLGDSEAIAQEVSNIKAVAPALSSRYQVTAKGTNTNTQVMGITEAYSQVREIKAAEGSFITEQDYKNYSKVAVLGPTTRDDLFGEGADAIGQIIRINKINFKVVGITETKGGSGFSNADDMLYIPLSTAQKFLSGNEYVSTIYAQAASQKLMDSAQKEITSLLLMRHKISDSTLADFSVINQADIVSAASSVTDTFTMLLAAVAGISLIVGGIGIMNMMLTTVTERTREIGLRKAIGAKNKDISSQFLAEAVMLTFIGGIAGIIFGWAISFAISTFGGITTEVSLFSIILAVGISGIIGIVFGYYPARRASKLNPIEALRYE